MDKDSREILAIRRDWDEEDEECQRQQMYVKYPYVPGPGFYGTGMLNILGNASAAMTAAWREALDAGMFANFPAGLMAKLGGRQNTSTFRLAPGEFQGIETNGMPIAQIVTGLPYKDVTPGLLTLIDKITDQCRALGNAAEIPAAEGLANVPVGTMLAQIEQATKVMAAAHKGMHGAQGEEFGLLIELFRSNPEDFWRQNKECPSDYWSPEKLLQALDNCQLVPVADPNVPSHIHRVAKALGLVQLSAMPQFATRLDPDEVLRRVLAAMHEDPIGLMVEPPPQAQQPDPEAMAKLITAQAKVKEAETKVGKLQVDARGQDATQQLKLAELRMGAESDQADIQKELIIHAADQAKLQAAERRDSITLAVKLQGERDKADQVRQKHGLELVKQGVAIQQEDRDHMNRMAEKRADIGLKHQQTGVAARTADLQHSRELAKLALDRDKAGAEAMARAHEVLNPPKPPVKPKPKRK
jgi:hypothetical protein